ncbi:MAG: hypothetical protein EP318_13890 [Rhodobacteraceae bacterium]|nr:MAG: hypothetical protein EP318_13890 [Paracoccaceae bacterium]
MRILLASCLCLLPAASFAANQGCALAGEIADKLVAERQNGTALYTAMETVAGAYTGKQKAYVEIIPGFADWIYSLPEDELGPMIGKAVLEQCEAKAGQ